MVVAIVWPPNELGPHQPMGQAPESLCQIRGAEVVEGVFSFRHRLGVLPPREKEVHHHRLHRDRPLGKMIASIEDGGSYACAHGTYRGVPQQP